MLFKGGALFLCFPGAPPTADGMDRLAKGRLRSLRRSCCCGTTRYHRRERHGHFQFAWLWSICGDGGHWEYDEDRVMEGGDTCT